VLQSGVDGGDAKAKDSSNREADVQMSPQGMTMPDPKDVLAVLWRSAEQPESALEAIKLTGTEPGLPSSLRSEPRRRQQLPPQRWPPVNFDGYARKEFAIKAE
jgi:hypothetical protein